MQFVIPALKVAGTVLAAKTAIEGLKEGNLLKAVMGGFGAYVGMGGLSGLGTQAANASQLSELANAANGIPTLNEASGVFNVGSLSDFGSTTGLLTDGMTEAATLGLGTEAASGVIPSLGTQAAVTSMPSVFNTVADAGGLLSGTSLAGGTNLIPDIISSNGSGLVNGLDMSGIAGVPTNNPLGMLGDTWNGLDKTTKYGLMQIGGGMLQGQQQQAMLEDQRNWQAQQEADRRRRMGYVASQPWLNSIRFNPTTRKWEMSNARTAY